MKSPWVKFNYKKIDSVRNFPLEVDGVTYQILINPDVGSWVALTEEEYKDYREGNLEDMKLENLFLRKIVKRKNGAEVEIDFPEPAEYPSVVVVNITSGCNMRCKYCFAESGPDSGEKMDDKTIEELVDQMFNMPKIDRFTLEFQGGEALAYFDGIKKAVKYAESKKDEFDKDVNYRIETNGTLINDEVVDFAKKYDIVIGISVDGPKELNDEARVYPDGSGTFSDIKEGIQKLKETGLGVAGSVCTIGKHNVSQPEKIANFFRDVDVSFKPRPVNILGRELENNFAPDSEDWFECYKKLHKMGRNEDIKNWSVHIYEENVYTPVRDYICLRSPCGAARELISVNPNGDVFPCDGFKGCDEWVIGNINEEKIVDMLEESKAQKIRNRSYEDIEKCSSCLFRGMCGSCAYSCYGAFGSIFREDPQCEARRKIFKYLIKYWIKHQASPEIQEKESTASSREV